MLATMAVAQITMAMDTCTCRVIGPPHTPDAHGNRIIVLSDVLYGIHADHL